MLGGRSGRAWAPAAREPPPPGQGTDSRCGKAGGVPKVKRGVP
jgi:hypothetical protein